MSHDSFSGAEQARAGYTIVMGPRAVPSRTQAPLSAPSALASLSAPSALASLSAPSALAPIAACREGDRLSCCDVGGFVDALAAARDAFVPAPSRLVLIGLDAEALAWIDAWSEDADQVRRELLIQRADGAQVTVVATLATHGYGVPTALAVESVRSRHDSPIVRSGVHLRVDVEAALAWNEADRE